MNPDSLSEISNDVAAIQIVCLKFKKRYLEPRFSILLLELRILAQSSFLLIDQKTFRSRSMSRIDYKGMLWVEKAER